MFNNWHAAIPGPTMVNRAYIDSATSDGMGWNDPTDIILGYPQHTIFQVGGCTLCVMRGKLCEGWEGCEGCEGCALCSRWRVLAVLGVWWWVHAVGTRLVLDVWCACGFSRPPTSPVPHP